MRKRFYLLIGILLISVVSFLGLLILAKGHHNEFAKTTLPEQWKTYQTVGKAEIALPEKGYEVSEIHSQSSWGRTDMDQTFTPSTYDLPSVSITHIKTPFWYSWRLKFAKVAHSDLFNQLAQTYRAAYAEEVKKTGATITWNLEKQSQMELFPNPVKIIGINLILYREGILVNQEGVTFVHQHYCWIEDGDFYVIALLYPKKLEKQVQPKANQIIQNFQIRH